MSGFGTGLVPVSPRDFEHTEDLPIGQVLRRITSTQAAPEPGDEEVSEVALRLAAGMQQVGARSQRSPTLLRERAAARPRAERFVQAGQRYIPLHIDTAFGRSSVATQELIPHDGWSFDLDAALLRLWVEEELAELQPEEAWYRHTQARTRPAQPAEPRRSTPARPALPSPRREEVRRAVLAASQGEPERLAQLLHGAEAASLLREERQRAAARHAAPTTALSAPLLSRLNAQVPRLGVDATGPDFSFDRAATQVYARAAQRQASSLLGATPAGATPRSAGAEAPRVGRAGALAQRALNAAAQTTRGAARLFGLTPREIQLAQERAALQTGLRAFAPSLRSDAGPLAAATGERLPQDARGLSAPGVGIGRSLALKAVEPEHLGSVLGAVEGSPSRMWMMEGGRGMLLAGLDDGRIKPTQPAQRAGESLWDEPTRAQATPPRAQATRPDGATPQQPTLTPALARLLLAAQRAEIAQRAEASQRAAAIAQQPTQAAAATIAQRSALPRAEQEAARLLAAQRGAWAALPYDATSGASFSEVLQRAVAAQQRADVGAPRATRLGLQDITVRGDYLPALAGSLDRLDASAARLDAFAPTALRASDTSALAAERLAPSRGVTLADGTAARAEEGFANQIGAPAQQRAYRNAWGAPSVLLAPERAAAPDLAALLPSEPQARRAFLRSLGAVAVDEVRSVARPEATASTLAAWGAAAPSTSGRQLNLFSPQKALALIAPQLESGGLLDATSRRELTAAMEALAAQAPSSSSPVTRRVRTPYGVITLRSEGGRVTVDAEEISSNAPAVRIAQPLSAPGAARQGLTSAPTLQAARMERLVGAPSLGARSSEGLEITLGAPSRAERAASAALQTATERAQALQATRRADAPRQATRLGLGDDRVQLRAASPQAAHLTQLLAQATSSPQAAQTLARILGRPDLAALAQPAGALVEPGAERAAVAGVERAAAADAQRAVAATSPQVTRTASLERWLEHVAPANAERSLGGARTAEALAARDLSPSLQAALVEHRAQALADALADASERRIVGNLGAVAMRAPARGGHLSRADLAYVLPYLQRQVEPTTPATLNLLHSRAATRDAARAAEVAQATAAQTPAALRRDARPGALDPRTGAQSLGVTPASAPAPSRRAPLSLERALLQAGLSLGQAEHLVTATRTLGLSNRVLTTLLGDDASEQPTSAFSGPGGFAALPYSSALREERVQIAQPQPIAATAQRAAQHQERLSSLDRLIHQARVEAGEVDARRIDTRLMTTQEPRALGGAVLRQLGSVREVLTALAPQRAAAATRPAGSMALPASLFTSTPGALLSAATPQRADLAGAPLTREQLATLTESGAIARTLGAAGAPQAGRLGSAATGAAGVWMPDGVQRLAGMGAEAFVGARGAALSEALVVPSLFSARAQEPLRRSEGAEISSPGQQALRLSTARLEEAAHSLALGLKQLSGATTTAQRRDEAPGDMIGLAGSMDRISQRILPRSASQRGIDQILASLDMAPEHVARPGAHPEGDGLVQIAQRDGASPDAQAAARPTEGSRAELIRQLTQRATSSPYKSASRVQGAEITAKRELFSPFSAPQPDAPSEADFAPRASMGGSGPSPSGDGAASKATAEQSNLPILDDIEETAHEVWAHIKRLIAVEFERRGVE